MALIKTSQNAHWYLPDGTPMHEVPNKSNGGMRPAHKGDARKAGAFPSVTTILKTIHKPLLANWQNEQFLRATQRVARDSIGEEFLAWEDDDPRFHQWADAIQTEARRETAEAAAKGTAIHAMTEAYDIDHDTEPPDDPDMRKTFDAYIEWFQGEGFDEVWSEMVVTNKAHGYAGQVDLLGTTPDGPPPVLVDKKTAKTKPGVAPTIWDEWKMQLAAYAAALPDALNVIPRTGVLVISRTEPGRVEWSEVSEEDLRDAFMAFMGAFDVWQFLNNYYPKENSDAD